MATYELSLEAEGDHEGIYYRGVLDFGLQQADDYYDRLLARFQQVADKPLVYPEVSYIREGYRSFSDNLLGQNARFPWAQHGVLPSGLIVAQNDGALSPVVVFTPNRGFT